MAPPLNKQNSIFSYGKGISRESCLIDLGVEHKILQKSGTWYSYNDTRLGQGKENTRDFLQNNPQLADEIEEKIRALLTPALEQKQDDTSEDQEKNPAK